MTRRGKIVALEPHYIPYIFPILLFDQRVEYAGRNMATGGHGRTAAWTSRHWNAGRPFSVRYENFLDQTGRVEEFESDI